MLLPGHIPLQLIENEITVSRKIALYVLRLDTIDLYAGGNKLFKLKYNLAEVKTQGYKKLLTFGGAWSNHLAAIAAGLQGAVSSKQLEVIAVVRGEEPKELSDTLRFCKEKGIQLHFVSREEYRRKNEKNFIEELKNKFGDFYLLPEGGSNALAVKGCREIPDLVNIDFDVICCPVGSGATIAGIANGLKEEQRALGFVVLKGGTYLEDVITKLRTPLSPKATPLKGDKHFANFKLFHDYHFGGFAKTTPQLLTFKKDFEENFGFELDHIYTSKMFYGIFDLATKNYFKENTTVIAVHTGGLQGNKGFLP
jgi:1-aminocyclopropane-1-carboxylate deaminase